MNRLDMKKINKRIKGSISTESALRNIVPFIWSDEVLSGEKKVIVTDMERTENEIKLNITYK